MTHDFGIISAKRTFKGYSEEGRKRKLSEKMSLSQGKMYQVFFQFIRQSHLEELKNHIGNKIV